ncbi:MAG: glucose-6-phosphate isomerase [Pseudomonadales bacterium]
MSAPELQPAWKDLTKSAAELGRRELGQLLNDEDRNQALSVMAPGMLLDFSKQRLDLEVVQRLVQLAEQQDMAAQIERLFCGEHVNATEDRPALHTALRARAGERPRVAEAAVSETLARMRDVATALASGSMRGYSGRAIRDLVHIGIGGSHLGPELAVEALTQSADGGPRCHFVANVDGEALTAALRGLSPETTLFIVVSKSFSTTETRVNAVSARSWFVERSARPEALHQHFLGVTANVAAAVEFGIAEDMIYPMWDWVGGRFSLWSAVGLPIALTAGPEAFAALLEGARDMDQHFRSTPFARNGPMLMALAGIWNYNFLGATSHAVLPYNQRLRLLPDYLQQLEMESNGKSVRADGAAVGVHSMPIVWGGEGTNGQHAFHQLLHQGTHAFTADFILTAQPEHGLAQHHRWLLANGLAQSQAMMAGQQSDDPHRAVPGNKPTTTIVLDRLSPYALGALLACYEHKVFCQGVIWNINSFDQWGVELGKRLALPIYDQLGGASTLQQDASTRRLISHLRGRQQE